MVRLAALRSRLAAGLAVAGLIVSGLTATVIAAPAAVAEPTGVQQRPTTQPTADLLPTPQINGVVWTQLIVGNTVYVGGSFTSARPAGAAPGVNETPRNYLLSYDLTTGALNPWAPVLNQQVNALAVSPDGSRLYVGGQFTAVDSVARYRIATFDTATGALITSFQPKVDYIVSAIVATSTRVYMGGAFSSANGSPRPHLAAFDASNGSVLSWAPTTDGNVQSMVISPDGSKVIAGGLFTNVNGAVARGTASINADTGASLPWAANTIVTNGGTNSGILSLSTDGTYVYGGGYKFGSTGNLEGMFKADFNGTLQWIEDCHGDTYGVYAAANAVYQVGHSHYCGNDLGWPQPATWDYNRAISFTKNATGTLIHEPLGYTQFNGTPSPSLLSWFPNLAVGTYTGKSQAAWSVAGNNTYVLLGGEFPSVNGIAQQGLARFAVKGVSPGASGPLISGALYKPTLNSATAGSVRISFRANWDRDDRSLTYRLFRNGSTGTPIYTTTVDSAEWERPAIGFTDTGLTPGAVYNYRIQVTDGDGNVTWGDGLGIAAAGTTTAPSAYGQTVLAQGASIYWPLNDSSGTTARDWAGYNDASLDTGVTLNAGGAIGGDTAMTFSGAAGGSLASAGSLVAPNTYTIEAWFKTTTLRGGRIMGFSDLKTGNSAGHRDRQVYMGNNGKLNYAVFGTTNVSFASANAYNDGQWHQAVATLGSNGMTLYVDGLKVGSRTDVTTGEKYVGYWRVGGDNASGYSNAPTSPYLAGDIDEVSVYPTQLTSQQINAQYVASGRTAAAPADSYGASVFYDDPTLYWRLGDTTGTAAADSATGLTPGTYQATNTKGVAGAIAGTANTAVAFNGSNGFVSSNSSFVNPTTYSEEAWFKTTTTTGGKIIGFGNAKTGLSTSYDRHVYMQNDGKIAFGALSAANVIVSPTAYNNGQWHHVVATQGATGMNLYIDGLPVGSNPLTTPAVYTGYWRVGGDKTWNSTSSYFNGTIDEAAVYPTVLSAARVQAHFAAGGGLLPNVLPTAAFTSTATKLALTVDGSTSTDSDGTISSYAWNFGDGGTGSGANASHTYGTAGSYLVTLTVTDNRGGTAVKSAPVSVVANVAPTAAFTATPTFLSAAFDASGSTDSDGTVASYAWDFGDSSTGSGVTASHSYAVAGTYPVTLTVTDNDGSTSVLTRSVAVSTAPNAAPTAAFTSTPTHLSVAFDGTGSTDSNGTVAGYAWDFGDGNTAIGPTPTNVYAVAGTYTVTLTVTDNEGATGVTSRQQTVALNTAPTAVIATSSAGLVLNVNGSASTDSDGTISSYAWDFGDGGTANTVTAAHTYAALGAYTVTLTVTDNDGTVGTSSAVVNIVPAVFVSDLFNRTVAGGWGSAAVGGAWTVTGGATGVSVVPGLGKIALATAGTQRTATLASVSQTDVDLRLSVSLDKAPVGGSTQFSTDVRKVGTTEYRSVIQFNVNGTVTLSLVRLVAGVATTLKSQVLSGLTYAAGMTLNLRYQVVGSGTTALQAKVWNSTDPEPAASQVTSSDATAALQGPGAISLVEYVSTAATNAPVVVSVSGLNAQAPGA